MSGLTDYLDSLDNLAGGWNLDSTSGDDPDVSGNGNDAVITLGAGSRGAAAIEVGGTLSLDFDGANTKAQAPSSVANTDIWDGGGSLFMLFHLDAMGEGVLPVLYTKGNTSLNQLSNGNLRMQGGFSPGSGLWATTNNNSAPVGTDCAIVVTYNADATTNDPTFYIHNIDTQTTATLTVGSGLTESSTPTGTRLSDSASPVVLGNTGNQNATLDGRISVVRIYSDVLTSDEINTAFAWADGTNKDATVTSVTATATASAQSPTATGTTHSIQSVTATASAAGAIPTPDLSVSSVTAAATASAGTPAPTLTLATPTATSTAAASVPIIPGPGDEFAIPGPPPEIVYVGTDKAVYAQFRDADGVFFDPDTISFMTRAPDGTKTTYVWQTDSEVEIDAIGVYHLTFNVSQPGTWTVAAKGTDGDAVGQVTFEAQASVFG